MRVLLTVDSMNTGEAAVQQFRARPWPAGTTVEILCVVDPSYITEIPQLTEEVKQRAKDLACSETGADFVLVGAHRGGESSRFLFGSLELVRGDTRRWRIWSEQLTLWQCSCLD